MEINIYNLQKNNDEFKDLTYDQLMKIGELCLEYYKKGSESAREDAEYDYESTVSELETEVDDLKCSLDQASKEYEELKEKYEKLKNANHSKR